MKNTKKLALSAVFTALGVAVMYIGALIEVLDLSIAAIASLFVYFAVVEEGEWHPWAIWFATSVLSLLLLPTKFGALCYALFIGVYPMFKLFFEKNRIWIAWVLKLSMFNTALILIMLAVKYLFSGSAEIPYSELIYFGLGNLAFILYDIAMSKLLIIYTVRWRRRLKIDRLFKN